MRTKTLQEDKAIELCNKALIDYKMEYVTMDHIRSRSRKAVIIKAKSICCYVLRQNGFVLTEIGQVLNIDHSTVIHLVNKVNGIMADKKKTPIKKAVALRRRIKILQAKRVKIERELITLNYKLNINNYNQ